ncbi:hypothetical protein E5K00_16370 [Hymenobacter aquaticus]|uniref:Outer membrane protein beta-barrel domain-containing protein n=1 Tax=Hymenobacter aquaticus TaxID=1867101 RepID=A0A4Z0PY45_9BACT|nr:outer membrane beta-barrel protein [Hymenobacter aquaticus]TGE21841.1 hypothetical protein E5K00_16370 [Hymenobacter aquaticus]
MVPTANNHTPTPEPTGDLEQLFRQKLGDAEVAPRMHLWDQIDHELLVQQNETYRRRLAWHRWAAAACILFFLAAGSWFSLRRPGSSDAQLAAVAGAENAANSAGRSAHTTAGVSAAAVAAEGQEGLAISSAPVLGADAGISSLADVAAVLQAAIAGPAAHRPSVATVAVAQQEQYPAAEVRFGTNRPAPAMESYSLPASFGTVLELPAGSFFDRVVASRAATSGTTASASALFAGLNSYSAPASAAVATILRLPQPDTSKLALPSAPASAVAQHQARPEQQQEMAPARPKRWRLMGAYAASAYNPNMSFGSGAVASVSGSSGFGPSTYRAANTYEQAATEYRRNLRPGFAQRVALIGSYAATKHWTLSAGVEVAEQRATSQTSYNFLDGRMPAVEVASANKDYGNSLTPPPAPQLRTAQYRYRTGGIPVSVRYGSARKGVSLYAKVGAAVNVLFNSRSELQGVPESVTSYSLTSTDSPYRKVQTSVNGGAGVRYQPTAGQWSLALGPVAEAGLSTLNTNATQASYQVRPYAIGMEASVEFGGKQAVVVR